jgi:Protein of unknown function (DUF3649)
MERAGLIPVLRRTARALRASPRGQLASRVLAAVVGGYAFTSLLTVVVSVLLPQLGVPRAQAVLAASMVSFFVYAAVILGVFHARSAAQAWRGLLLSSLPLTLVLLRHLPGTLE